MIFCPYLCIGFKELVTMKRTVCFGLHLIITMKYDVLIFEHSEFGNIRGFKGENGEAWLMATDVARRLGYTNPQKAIRDHVDVDDKTLNDSFTVNGTVPVLINESGLYSLILSSKLPKAREFKHWVTSVVLPQIRKTGGYIKVDEDDDDNSIMAKALMIAQKTIAQKDALLAEQKPKVMFADAVTSQDDSILISEMAKLLTQNGYEIGRTRFFRWLREKGYIFKRSTEPIQKWVERGIFDTHVTIVNTNHGQREAITTKVTGKGQKYFIDLFIR